MASQTIDAAWLLDGGDPARRDCRLTISDGAIASVDAMSDVPKSEGPAFDALVMPALTNAHDHVRVARLSQVGSFDVPLEAWLPYLSLIPAVDPWLAAAVAFGRTARGGVGTVMAHYTRVQGLTDLPTELRAVAKASRDVGLRVGLAIQLRDRNPLLYDPHDRLLAGLSSDACDCVTRRFLRPPLPPQAQIDLVEAMAAELEGDGITVQYGPAAVQWCSDALLAGIAEASAANGRRVHMHLLETRYQRLWADRAYPDGIVRHLDQIGLVGPHVSFAHGTHLRPDEMELIAERGATIVVNTSSNLALNSGIAAAAEMVRRGCRVALGLDGAAFDEDEDAVREMRLLSALNRAQGFDERLSAATLLEIATANGRFAVCGEPGRGIAPGAPADVLLLDWTALSAELIEPNVPPLDLLVAKARREHVRGLFVGGREVVRDGAVAGIDLPALEAELLTALRAAFPSTAAVRAVLPELRAAIRGHYTGPLYCS